MSKIKEYIEFAIDNGYKLSKMPSYSFEIDDDSIVLYHEGECFYEKDIIRTITSEPFIEAIARGILDKKWLDTDKNYKIFLEININEIVTKQAFAIANWELESFITKLLQNESISKTW